MRKSTGVSLLTIVLILSVFASSLTLNARADIAGTWKKVGSRYWYSHNDGTYTRNGWEKIGGVWYHFDKDGWMQTGWIKDGSIWYYLEASGAMAHDKWVGDYYLTSSGAMAVSTWIGNYYVGADGKWVPNAKKPAAKAQWLKDSTGWWYRHADGSYTRNGWELIDGTWYYFDAVGYMKTGWILYGNEWYYLESSGAMAHDKMVGEHYMTSSGAMSEYTWEAAGKSYDYYVIYAEGPDIIGKIPKTDLLVIDAETYTADDIARIKAIGVKQVFSYLNVGSLEEFRSFYSDYENITLGDYEGRTDEKWVDVSNAAWQNFLKQRISALTAKGVDGFYLDNIDVYEHYQNDDIYNGIVTILQYVNSRGKKVIVNEGMTFAERCLGNGNSSLIWGVNKDEVFTKYDYDTDTCGVHTERERRSIEQYLDKLSGKGVTVFAIEYATDAGITEQAYAYGKERGYKCYVADNIRLKLNAVVK